MFSPVRNRLLRNVLEGKELSSRSRLEERSAITFENRCWPFPVDRRKHRPPPLLELVSLQQRVESQALAEVRPWAARCHDSRGKAQYHLQRNCACSHSPQASGIRAPSVDVWKNRTETFSVVVYLAIRREDQRCCSNLRTDLAVLNLKTFRRCPWTSSKVVKAEFQSHERDPPPSSSGSFFSLPLLGKCNKPQRYRRLIG